MDRIEKRPLHFNKVGQGRSTILLVHGWTCDEHAWSEQIPVLAKSRQVVTIDLPGHGLSGLPPEGKFSIDVFAHALETARRVLDVEKVALIGHSMGASVAIQYARLYPRHTAAMILADGVVTTTPALQQLSGAMMAGPDGIKRREATITGMFSASTTAAMQRKILDMMLAPPQFTAAGALDAMLAWAAEDAGRIDVPTLAIYAENSWLEDPDYLRAHFSDFERTEIPGSGHFLMIEKPREFNDLVLRFLDERRL